MGLQAFRVVAPLGLCAFLGQGAIGCSCGSNSPTDASVADADLDVGTSVDSSGDGGSTDARSMVFVEEDLATPFDTGSADALRLGFVTYPEPQLCSGFIEEPPPGAVFATVTLVRPRGEPIVGVYAVGGSGRAVTGASTGFGSDGLPESGPPAPLAGGTLEVLDVQPFAVTVSGQLTLAGGEEVGVSLDATPCPLGM